jgi:hypothetical protein
LRWSTRGARTTASSCTCAFRGRARASSTGSPRSCCTSCASREAPRASPRSQPSPPRSWPRRTCTLPVCLRSDEGHRRTPRPTIRAATCRTRAPRPTRLRAFDQHALIPHAARRPALGGVHAAAARRRLPVADPRRQG